MGKTVEKWLMSENKIFSEILESKTSNLSIVGVFVSISLIGCSLALANSQYYEESRLLQGLLLIISVFAMCPLYNETKSND